MMFNAVSSVIVMIRDPPGEPSTSATCPSLITIVGAIDDNGRLPGAIAFAAPCTRPNWLGVFGRVVKSSISSFSTTPVPGAMITAPKLPFSV